MTNRWYLRGAAVALAFTALALGAGLAGFFRISHARRTSLREWNDQRCSVYRSTFEGADDPCSAPTSPAPLFRSMKDARTNISRARLALDAGDETTAARELGRALDRASAIERASSLLATAMAARATSEVLDVVDSHPSLARRSDLQRALVRTKLATAQRPLEAERLRAAQERLKNGTSGTAFLTWGASDARLADEIEAEDAALLTMQRAARAGDHAACERAGARTHHGHLCARLVGTMATAKRLSARSRGLATDQRLDLRTR